MLNNSYPHDDDQALLHGLNNGNHKAFAYLYATYYTPLCNLSATYLQDDERAKDLVQQVFLRLWESHPSLHITTSVKNYLYTMVKNASLNLLRNTPGIFVRATSLDAAQLDSIADTDLQECMERNTRYACFLKAIGRLPMPQRNVFLLKSRHSLSNKEIAARMGISESTVKNYYNLSLRLLRHHLKTLAPAML